MNKYQKVKMIGEGSFGKAFLVRDKQSNKQYVIKVSKSIANILIIYQNISRHKSFPNHDIGYCIHALLFYSTADMDGGQFLILGCWNTKLATVNLKSDRYKFKRGGIEVLPNELKLRMMAVSYPHKLIVLPVGSHSHNPNS